MSLAVIFKADCGVVEVYYLFIFLFQISSEDVVCAFIDRIRAVNVSVNAVVSNRFDAALAEAKEVDRLLQQDPLPAHCSVENAPFLGVPFSAKEAFAITGKLTINVIDKKTTT